jgi:1-acyl-sn-glycerol-3-phosphate acyltransferase
MKQLFRVLLNVLCFWKWPRMYMRYIEKITASGHIGRPSAVVIFFSGLLFNFLTFIWVGRVKLVGEENLNAGDRVIVTPNHSSLLDAIISFAKIRKPVWAIGADHVLKKCWGLIGLLATKMRTMPVDRSHGKTVIEPAIELVVQGNSLVMFPEGRISPDGTLLPFKLGAAIIGWGALMRLGPGGRVGIVPTAICYNRRDVGSATNYFKMGFKWRAGATIVFCKPIWLDELVDHDPEHIMGLVREAIEAALRSHNGH